jgi:cob(II)yrinic acid a,c-diamide reductase
MLPDPQTLTFSGPTTTTGAYDLDEPAARSWQVPNDFRHGIRHLTRGVNVVTVGDEHGEDCGITTTGVCALSMEPPTLVICIRRRSRLGTQLPRTKRFCVNVLSSRQRAIAEAFTGRRGVPVDRFNHGRWTKGRSGSPVLTDALASFECEVDLLYGYPNHLIVVGSVLHVERTAKLEDPLIYTGGQLSSLVPSGVPMAAPA